MDRRLRVALGLNLAVQGSLVAAARHRLSYDAYTHIFLADHYQRGWWTLWEPRWYTGFSVASYPPLVHQLIALLARLVGLEIAYGLLLLAVLAAMPLAIYAFARIFVPRRSAGTASLAGLALPGIYVSAHAFGQLPTLAALLATLLALAALDRYLERGRAWDGALAIALVAVVGAAHHGTLLLLPWGVMAVAAQSLVTNPSRVRQVAIRLAYVLPIAAAAAVFVVWPFWQWGLDQTMQMPIDHLSRHNLLRDPPARRLFFWAMYGPLVAMVPIALWLARKRERFVLGALFTFLFLLGLGGTTPLPRWLFGARWAWLTYDRFALWAGVALLPFAGLTTVRLEPALRRYPQVPWRIAGGVAMGLLIALMVPIAVLSEGQPARVDMAPIADFLAQDGRSRWRYLTFGFGDQAVRLSILTEATTIDGNYHTARPLPELRQSGIGMVDTALWATPGLNALHPVLERAGERGVRWGFVNRADYAPILAQHGWRVFRILSNGVEVWVNPEAVVPAGTGAGDDTDPVAAAAWGVLPLLTATVAAGLALARLWQGRPLPLRPARAWVSDALGHVHHLAVGLLPLALCFWIYHTLFQSGHQDVHLVYRDALFFLSDGVVLVAAMAWAGRRLLAPPGGAGRTGLSLGWVLLLLVALAAASVAWSTTPGLSFHAALHLGLMLALFVSLKDRPGSWRFVAIGSLFALLVVGGTAVVEFLVQSTGFLTPLGLELLGPLTPDVRGASVVELADGTRWLRAYGTLPHPNILGGWLILLLAAPVSHFLRGRRPRWWLLPLFGLGIAALLLSFSRSAWLGLAAATGVIVLHRRKLERGRLLALAAVAIVSGLLVVIPLRRLVYTRLAGFSVHTEARSIRERTQLGRQALDMIEARPLLGTGIGAFVTTMAEETPEGTPVEPDHNVPRLAAAELGVGGGILTLVAAAVILYGAWKAWTIDGVVLSAIVVGLMLPALFDHYVWSLSPGRTMAWLALGVWAGQVSRRVCSSGGE